jgi:hypothetical protein
MMSRDRRTRHPLLGGAAATGAIDVPFTRTDDLEDVPQGLADFAAGTVVDSDTRKHHLQAPF